MRVLEVRVENFRGLRGPVTVEFGPGLNVIHGPNEIGKSTLAQAIWDGLTLPSRIGGQTLIAMTPRSGGTPVVRIQFERGGVRYQVTKSFAGRQGNTSLRIEGDRVEQLRDEEAEARLRQVLGVGAPNNRGKIGDIGLWPLVWVEQGRSVIAPTDDLNVTGRAALSKRLAALGGEVFAGHGAEELFRAAEERYLRFYTASGAHSMAAGAPLRKASERFKAAEGAFHDLNRRLADHEQRLKRHAHLRGRLGRLGEQLPTLEVAHQRAVEAVEKLEVAESRLAAARTSLKLATSEHQRMLQRVEQRATLRATADEQAARAGQLEQERDEKRAALQAHRDLRPALHAAVDQAQAAERAATQRRRRLQAAFDVHESTAQLKQLSADLKKAEAHQRELQELKAKLVANRVTGKVVTRLRRLAAEASEAEARLDAVAAQLEVHALGPVRGQLQDQPLALEAGEIHSARVHEPTALLLGDQVRVVLRPGGDDLAARRARQVETRRALQRALDELELADLDAAERAAEQRLGLEREAAGLQRVVDQIDAERLGIARAEAEARATQARALLDGLGPAEGEVLPTERPALQRLLAEAEASLEQTLEAQRQAQQQLSSHDQLEARMSGAFEGYTRQLTEARRAAERAETAWAEHVQTFGDDPALTKKAAELLAEVQRQQAEVQERQAELEPLEPEQIRRELASTGQALKAARDEQREARDQIHRLEGELSGEQGLGLHDRVEKARAEQEQAAAALAAEQRRAEAAKLLYETLSEARAAAQRRHLAPLLDEVGRLLRLVFPGATVDLGEGLDGVQLDRGVAEGQHPFDELSGGAREQLGVLVRLALARLLAEQEPLPVLLDDALVSTDEERFKGMRRVLDAASEDLQVIFLTCHWDRLRVLGLAPDHRVDLAQVIAEA